ncbi:MAG: DUF4911 domain-containing protein [Candidatus Cloacimonetes bacterium]|nr:DUF4911 domain-containing protein [Candidatus Cloacimonadota bacterium]
MNFQIKNEKLLSDKTGRFNICIQKNELVYMGYFLESFEGWCNYTTPNKSEPVLQVDVAPDYINDLKKMMKFLKSWEL